MSRCSKNPRKARERAKRYGVGDYYKLDFYRNIITEQGVDPEELGREMGVLRPWNAWSKTSRGRRPRIRDPSPYGSLKSPVCSCVSITLPAPS